MEIPTNKKMTRLDNDIHEIYRTLEEKYNAIIKLVEDCRAKKQPCLVGTVSIEKSEEISKFLKKEKIPMKCLMQKIILRRQKL